MICKVTTEVEIKKDFDKDKGMTTQ